MLKRFVSVCAFAVLVGAFPGTTDAQPVDARTYFTFSQPVTLPGVTLPAGTYLFRIPDATTSRQIVQVLSPDGTRLYTTLMAIRAQRPEATAEPEVRFMETAANVPAAIKTWWYPGNPTGWEFIYPKEQALRLAGMATQPVLTPARAGDATTEEMKTLDLARVDSAGADEAVTAEAQPAAEQPAGEVQEGEVAAADLTIPALPTPVDVSAAPAVDTRADGTSEARTELPRTASTTPLGVLLGIVALTTGIGLAARLRPRV
jgi:hypothetical protein